MELTLKQPKSLLEIAEIMGIEVSAADTAAFSAIHINRIVDIEQADAGCLTFLSNPIYKRHLATTKASAIVLTPQDAKDCATTALVTKNPRLALAKLLLLWQSSIPKVVGIHPSAVVGNNVQLGTGVTLEAGVVVGDNCKIGANTTIKANATIYHQVTIGANCTVHSNTVIGSDGFGYAVDTDGSWFKMLHLGGVVIGDNVEIGSNTCVDRGMIDDTVIGNNVIIDNLVQIAHNVIIGDRTAIAGCAAIAGSTTIGKACQIGGAASIAGHLTIGDRVFITGTSAVNHSLLQPGVYSSGFPAKENSVWRRNVARFMLLDSMAKKIKQLEKSIKTLVKTEDIT